MSPRHPPRAFTLIELLAVIAIIGILAGIVIGVGRRAGESGREARAKVELAAISTALESYKRQYGDYPRTNDAEDLLQALVGKIDYQGNSVFGKALLDLALFTMNQDGDPATNPTLHLVDPWDNVYRYYYFGRSASRLSGYVIYTAGTDGLDSAPTSLSQQNRDEPANLDNIYAHE